MEEIVRKHVAELQETLDGITRNGFWFGVFGDAGHVTTLLPHAIEVLDAQPVLGAAGKVTGWRDAVLVIDRGFADVGAPMHVQHLHVIMAIDWTRSGSDGRVYGATLKEEGGGQEFALNELDAGEHPDEAAEWRAHEQRLAEVPERVAVCLAAIRAEFGAMAERMLRG